MVGGAAGHSGLYVQHQQRGQRGPSKDKRRWEDSQQNPCAPVQRWCGRRRAPRTLCSAPAAGRAATPAAAPTPAAPPLEAGADSAPVWGVFSCTALLTAFHTAMPMAGPDAAASPLHQQQQGSDRRLSGCQPFPHHIPDRLLRSSSDPCSRPRCITETGPPQETQRCTPGNESKPIEEGLRGRDALLTRGSSGLCTF